MASYLKKYVSEEARASPEEQPTKARTKKRDRKWKLVFIFDEESDTDASREVAVRLVK